MQRTRNILKQNEVGSVSDETVFREVCKDVASDLGVDLVSIWFCGDPKDQSFVECQCRYDTKSETFVKGEKLYEADCPKYFETMIQENIIAARDVAAHPATRELLDSYFKPNGICSLLDFILHKNFRPYGVICCETRGKQRKWTEDDKKYLRTIAALVSHRFCDN